MTIFEFKERLLGSENLSDDTKKILQYEMGKILGEETVTIGGYEYDGHVYEDVEVVDNCRVTVSRCINCGKIDISWERSEGLVDD